MDILEFPKSPKINFTRLKCYKFSSSKFVADAASVRGRTLAPSRADAGCVAHDRWDLGLLILGITFCLATHSGCRPDARARALSILGGSATIITQTVDVA